MAMYTTFSTLYNIRLFIESYFHKVPNLMITVNSFDDFNKNLHSLVKRTTLFTPSCFGSLSCVNEYLAVEWWICERMVCVVIAMVWIHSCCTS